MNREDKKKSHVSRCSGDRYIRKEKNAGFPEKPGTRKPAAARAVGKKCDKSHRYGKIDPE
ncbi:MAG TPA: hypothetical protein PKN36_01075 [bacterium]|nr:hypothetical protein [bacterium]